MKHRKLTKREKQLMLEVCERLHTVQEEFICLNMDDLGLGSLVKGFGDFYERGGPAYSCRNAWASNVYGGPSNEDRLLSFKVLLVLLFLEVGFEGIGM